jgi:hypothetical protein
MAQVLNGSSPYLIARQRHWQVPTDLEYFLALSNGGMIHLKPCSIILHAPKN